MAAKASSGSEPIPDAVENVSPGCSSMPITAANDLVNADPLHNSVPALISSEIKVNLLKSLLFISSLFFFSVRYVQRLLSVSVLLSYTF